MIVKKMPIFQGFPAFETVKVLSDFAPDSGDFCPVFYDIETTGLSRNSAFVYLIGAVFPTENSWEGWQFFGEKKEDEKEILLAFSDLIKDFPCTVTYNGNRFDQPFIEERCRIHDLPSPFHDKSSLDLYQLLRPVKALLKLPRMKQPDMEAFLGLSVRVNCDGGECIRLYKKYLKSKDAHFLETVTGHNAEDLEGLTKIVSMLGYLCLINGSFTPAGAAFEEERLYLTLSLPYPLPAAISNTGEGFYITASEKEARLEIHTQNGKLRQYFPNYKDYDYIPSEDTAIPKSLAACMPKSLRRPAKKDTCYTWFDCTQSFLDNPAQQLQYLKNSLPFLLETL